MHIALAGIEKVVARLDDLAVLLPMLATAGPGQPMTCYNTLYGGPRQAGECDGPEEMHLVLLDNRRTALLADAEQRDALHCIRCGACLNVCPIFKNVGGLTYGTTYQGPIGSVITPHLRGLADWNHLSGASSLCGACTDACPVRIDIHHHLLHNRRNAARTAPELAREARPSGLLRSWPPALAFATAGWCSQDAAAGQGVKPPPLAAWLATRTLPAAPGKVFGPPGGGGSDERPHVSRQHRRPRRDPGPRQEALPRARAAAASGSARRRARPRAGGRPAPERGRPGAARSWPPRRPAPGCPTVATPRRRASRSLTDNLEKLRAVVLRVPDLAAAADRLAAEAGERGWQRVAWHHDPLVEPPSRAWPARPTRWMPASLSLRPGLRQATLEACDAGVSACECLVAQTGSILAASTAGGRALSILPPVHVVVAPSSRSCRRSPTPWRRCPATRPPSGRACSPSSPARAAPATSSGSSCSAPTGPRS